jgi:hypothetical protein
LGGGGFCYIDLLFLRLLGLLETLIYFFTDAFANFSKSIGNLLVDPIQRLFRIGL